MSCTNAVNSLLYDRTEKRSDLRGRLAILSSLFYTQYITHQDITDEERYLQTESMLRCSLFQLDYLLIPIYDKEM